MSPDSLLELDREGFRWVLWDGDVLSYDRLSGDTHRLYGPAGDLIRVLQDSSGPLRWGAVVETIESDSPSGKADTVAVGSAADALISIGLLQYSGIDTP